MLVDTENPSPWMRAIQAARYCNRSEGGWSRLIKQGKAPRSHKVCGLRMYWPGPPSSDVCQTQRGRGAFLSR